MKFHVGDSPLNDTPWLGRPDKVDSNLMLPLLENNLCCMTWKRTSKYPNQTIKIL